MNNFDSYRAAFEIITAMGTLAAAQSRNTTARQRKSVKAATTKSRAPEMPEPNLQK